jgi:hypothetical protein
VASLVLLGCTRSNPGAGGDGGGEPPGPVADMSGGGSGGGGGGGAGGGDDMAHGAPCYSEEFSPTMPSLSDLSASYSPQQWKADSLEALKRRYAGGHYLLDAMKDDPQLPGFVDSGTFGDLMMSLMTMCHEETHGYDYGHATANVFLYYMRPDLQVQPPQLQTFPRSEILSYIHDDATKNYDDTYLVGTQGTYDLLALGDELNAYTNGLGCITAVADQIGSGISARDGVAAHLYYLELYLLRARTAHPTVYASLKASPDWQKLVRYTWARGMFWRAAATPYPNLAIADAPIWTKVEAAENSAEIEMFTGSKVAEIACHP